MMANEKRLIDADEFLKWIVKRFKCVPLVGSCDNDAENVKLLLSQAPTVDAVEVVRCKGCSNSEPETAFPRGKVWCRKMCRYMKEDGFCSYGERRADG